MTALPSVQGEGSTSNDAILIDDPIEDDDDDDDEMNLTRYVAFHTPACSIRLADASLVHGSRGGSGTTKRKGNLIKSYAGQNKIDEEDVRMTGTRSRPKSMTAETPAQSVIASLRFRPKFKLTLMPSGSTRVNRPTCSSTAWQVTTTRNKIPLQYRPSGHPS